MAIFIAVRCSCAGLAPRVVALDRFFDELVSLSSRRRRCGFATPFLQHLRLELLCIRLLVLPAHHGPHGSSVVAHGVPAGFSTMVIGSIRNSRRPIPREPSTSPQCVPIPPPFLWRSRGLGPIAQVQRQRHRQGGRPCVMRTSRLRAYPNRRERRKVRSPAP